MYIESIELSNYRNYEELAVRFDSGTNIIFGDNAQGKTNILESLYLCGTTKSHRGSKDKDIIRFDCDESHIKMFVNKNDISQRIDIHLKKSKTKGIAINGVPVKKSSDLFGLVNIIFFSPEDLFIIKNGPSERRRFIDMELCQLNKIYLYNLSKYNKILEQRNRLLKDIAFTNDKSLLDTLDIWDMQIADYGSRIIEERQKFTDEINQIIYGIHRKLTDGIENLKVKYEPNVRGEGFYEKLKSNREKDLIVKSTTSGPHRDDIGFYLNDIDVRKFGSQGQQRTCALSLKLSEIEIVSNMIHDIPVLLLDDVLSELDKKRQNQLINCLKGIQTIITCTGLDEFVESKLSVSKVYKVVKGKIIEDSIQEGAK